jgi:hypothetical protein
VAKYGDDAARRLRDQLADVDDKLRTAAGGIDSGTRDEYLREGLLALHEAVTGLATVVEQLVDRGDAAA